MGVPPPKENLQDGTQNTKNDKYNIFEIHSRSQQARIKKLYIFLFEIEIKKRLVSVVRSSIQIWMAFLFGLGTLASIFEKQVATCLKTT